MSEKVPSFDDVIDFNNLYRAYKSAYSGHGHKNTKQKFKLAALDGICQIQSRLQNKTYKVSPYSEFVIREPKERKIKAGGFVDKIVQHSICDNVLHPTLKTEFLPNNFAGQEDKGTLYGLDWLRGQMYLAYQKYGYDCWIVKADISKFFYTIDHNILKDIIQYHFQDSDICWLCELFVDSTKGIGLPLGNQISQVFAILYLSGLDHFITGELGVPYYGRYMDDFYLIVESKEYAKECLRNIIGFLDTLHLEVNGKTQIIPFKNGIKFCGFHTYVTKNGKVIRKLTNDKKRAAKKKYKKMVSLVEKGKLSEEKFKESYESWKNHISHGNCIKLGFQMDQYVEELLKKAKEKIDE